MAAHSSILAWEIQQTEELDRPQFLDSQKSWTQLSDQATTAMYKHQVIKKKNVLQRRE